MNKLNECPFCKRKLSIVIHSYLNYEIERCKQPTHEFQNKIGYRHMYYFDSELNFYITVNRDSVFYNFNEITLNSDLIYKLMCDGDRHKLFEKIKLATIFG